MSDVSLDDLITPVTVDEAKGSIYGVLADLGVSTTSWKTGAIIRTFVAVSAVVVSGATKVLSLLARSGFRRYSTGTWLTLLAREVYGVDRIEATFATGEVTLINAGGGVYNDLEPGDVVFENVATGKTYTNSETFSLGAGQTLTVAIVAQELGTDSNAAAGQITEMVTTLLGVTCTNAAAVVGQDEESDEELEDRCDEKLDSLSPNGPSRAYSFLAKTATRTDGSNVGITRVSSTPNSATGIVTVTIANASGAVIGDDLTAVDNVIQSTCVPLGITATVQSAVAKSIPVTSTIYIYNTDGRTTAQIQEEIAALLGAWVSTRPIGGDISPGDTVGYVDKSAIQGEIKAVSGYCFRVVVSTPSTNVAIAANEVPILGTVSTTVVWTEPKK